MGELAQQRCKVERLSGVDLIERYARFEAVEAAGAAVGGNRIVGLTFDPVEDRFTVLKSGSKEMAMLAFWARTRAIEAALLDVMTYWPAFVAGEGDARLSSALTTVCDDKNMCWVLKRKEALDEIVHVGRHMLVFTAPDLAIRHYLEAKDLDADVPEMVAEMISMGAVRTQLEQAGHARAGGARTDGVWFNAPANLDASVTLDMAGEGARGNFAGATLLTLFAAVQS